jgi:ATP-dependent Lhr-like helicase
MTPVAEAGGLDREVALRVRDEMVSRGIVIDLDGVLQIGEEGEKLFGRRHFMDVTSLFLTEPLLAVRWGQRLLGQIDPSALLARESGQPVILLGGAAWAVGDIDWKRQVVWVEPTDEPGRSRWAGSGGALSIDVCHAMRAVAAAEDVPASASVRAGAALADIRESFWFLAEGRTAIERDEERSRARWWTFAGGRANAELRGRLEAAGIKTSSHDDLGISLLGQQSTTDVATAARSELPTAWIDWRRVEAVKFHQAVPIEELEAMLSARDHDSDGLARCVAEPIDRAVTT